MEPAKDVARTGEVVRFFIVAFARVCALRVVDRLVLDGLTVGWQGVRRLFFEVQLIHFPKEECLQSSLLRLRELSCKLWLSNLLSSLRREVFNVHVPEFELLFPFKVLERSVC